MAQMEVSEAGLEDLESLSRLFQNHFQEQASINPLAQTNQGVSYKELIRGLLQSGSNMIFIARDRDEGRIKGFIHLNIQEGGRTINFRPPEKEALMRRLTPFRVARKIVAGMNDFFVKRSSLQQLFKPRKMAYLGNIFVVPEARGRGVGGMLLDKGMEWAKKQNVDMMFLQVHAANQPGLKFWQRHGFETTKQVMVRNV